MPPACKHTRDVCFRHVASWRNNRESSVACATKSVRVATSRRSAGMNGAASRPVTNRRSRRASAVAEKHETVFKKKKMAAFAGVCASAAAVLLLTATAASISLPASLGFTRRPCPRPIGRRPVTCPTKDGGRE